MQSYRIIDNGIWLSKDALSEICQDCLDKQKNVETLRGREELIAYETLYNFCKGLIDLIK